MDHLPGSRWRQREHRDGEQVAGRDRHQHVVAGHTIAATARAAAQQRASILRVDLIEALAPAQTLVPGLLELLRLLVVDDCLAAVADTAAARSAGDGEFDVLDRKSVV